MGDFIRSNCCHSIRLPAAFFEAKSFLIHKKYPMKTPQSPRLPTSGIVLLILNALLILALLLAALPLIQLSLVDSVLEGRGFDITDGRTMWGASLLLFSVVGLFSLWKCYRPTQAWANVTIICLVVLLIHGFTGVNLGPVRVNQNGVWWENHPLLILAAIRIVIGALLAMDLAKSLNVNTPKPSQ
jgi:lysylphosphatidylglycerol synthetase-like protein (DUF2156 family)